MTRQSIHVAPGPSRRQMLRGVGASTLSLGLVGGTAACGNSGRQGSDPLAFWQMYGPSDTSAQSDWLTSAVETWNAENEIQVDPVFLAGSEIQDGTQITTAFSSGDGPDIFIINPNQFLRYYNPGALYDLSSHIDTETLADFDDAALAPLRVDGATYALPIEAEPIGMFYSIRAFEDAGLAEGDIPTTWDELLGAADALRGGDQFGMLLETREINYQAFQFYPWLWIAGSDLVTEDGTASAFDSPGTIAALEFWQTLIEEDLAPRSILGTGGGDAVSNLSSGYCAIQPTGSHEIGHLRSEADDFEYGVFPIPSPDGSTTASVTGGWSVAVSAQSSNPDAAAAFSAWLTADPSAAGVDRMVEFNTSKGNLPVRQTVQNAFADSESASSRAAQTFLDDILPNARFQPRYQQEIVQIAVDSLQRCVLDGADAADVAGTASQQIDSFLEGYEGAPLV